MEGVAALLRSIHPRRFRSFFAEFIRLESSSGILLIASTLVALVWANTRWADQYFGLWQTPLAIRLGNLGLDKPLLLWINDGLMAIFFLVVGLEIKREVMSGELSSPRRAVLPAVAALGGMLAPALGYAAFNWGTNAISGWGIAVATDIAFTLGVLALLGHRAPLALKIFITALAIVDDIGAVLVIALFYTSAIDQTALLVAGLALAALILLNRAGVRRRAPYVLLGLLLWVAVLKSGVHATVAGVLLAMTIPARVRVDSADFLARAHDAVTIYERAAAPELDPLVTPVERQQSAAQELEIASTEAESPLHSLEHDLHPWVSYAILPLFALANAGVPLTGGLAALAQPVSLGIIVGLVIGKPVGISLATWLAVKIGLAELPSGLGWRHLIGGACLAGIGFTMSIFIATLAFDDPALLPSAKSGVLAASLVAGTIGGIWLTAGSSPATLSEEQESAG